jgi:hypothetical protein
MLGMSIYSPDGQLRAVVNEDHGTLRLWDCRRWRQMGDTWALPEMFEGMMIDVLHEMPG